MVSSGPFFFHPTVDFMVESAGSHSAAAIFFQAVLGSSLQTGSAWRLKALGCSLRNPAGSMVPRRVAFQDQLIASGEALHMGRGSKAAGRAPSEWAGFLPSRAGLTARQALELYERRRSPDLLQKLVGLEGKTLACECPPNRRRHGDVLVGLFAAQKAAAASVGVGSAPSDQAARQAAAVRRAAVRVSRVKLSIQARQKPTREAGIGPPIFVGHGESRRLLADGAGLCSPGLWPPERRRPLVGGGGPASRCPSVRALCPRQHSGGRLTEGVVGPRRRQVARTPILGGGDRPFEGLRQRGDVELPG